MTDKDDLKALAFEYVVGTLRGEERQSFITQMRQDPELAEEVQYWENNLTPLGENVQPLAPKADTFSKIQAQIHNRTQRAPESKPVPFWERLLPWKMAASLAFAMVLAVSVVMYNGSFQSAGLDTDYVAVLMNDADEPVLTALTASENSKLWLKWENWQAPQDHSLQLWAKSRRDGQIRPLLVFASNELKEVELDEATLRLIKDSSHLIITQEEVGGSAIDEPSDAVIATGVCIRLNETAGKA